MPINRRVCTSPFRLDFALFDLMKVAWFSVSLVVLFGSAAVWAGFVPRTVPVVAYLFKHWHGIWVATFLVFLFMGMGAAIWLHDAWRSRPTSNPFHAAFKEYSKFLYWVLFILSVPGFATFTKDRAQGSVSPFVIAHAIVAGSVLLWAHIYFLRAHATFFLRQLRSGSASKRASKGRPSRFDGLA